MVDARSPDLLNGCGGGPAFGEGQSLALRQTQSGTKLTIQRIDLGDRMIDVIPIPGHSPLSVALYDRRTAILFPGDSLYPGRLYVPEAEISTYAASAKRLVEFVSNPAHPVAHELLDIRHHTLHAVC